VVSVNCRKTTGCPGLTDKRAGRAKNTIRVLTVLMLGIVLAAGTVAAFGQTEADSDQRPSGTEEDFMVLDGGDATGDPVEGGEIKVGATVRVRGRIDTYGNAPLTFSAIRTDAPAGYEGGPGGEGGPAGDAVWLLELSGVDQETLHEYSSGPVLVEGILRRLPEGPRQGLLEVRSLERAR
jgi:hypothetical protein